MNPELIFVRKEPMPINYERIADVNKIAYESEESCEVL